MKDGGTRERQTRMGSCREGVGGERKVEMTDLEKDRQR